MGLRKFKQIVSNWHLFRVFQRKFSNLQISSFPCWTRNLACFRQERSSLFDGAVEKIWISWVRIGNIKVCGSSTGITNFPHGWPVSWRRVSQITQWDTISCKEDGNLRRTLCWASFRRAAQGRPGSMQSCEQRSVTLRYKFIVIQSNQSAQERKVLLQVQKDLGSGTYLLQL